MCLCSSFNHGLSLHMHIATLTLVPVETWSVKLCDLQWHNWRVLCLYICTWMLNLHVTCIFTWVQIRSCAVPLSFLANFLIRPAYKYRRTCIHIPSKTHTPYPKCISLFAPAKIGSHIRITFLVTTVTSTSKALPTHPPQLTGECTIYHNKCASVLSEF